MVDSMEEKLDSNIMLNMLPERISDCLFRDVFGRRRNLLGKSRRELRAASEKLRKSRGNRDKFSHNCECLVKTFSHPARVEIRVKSEILWFLDQQTLRLGFKVRSGCVKLAN